MYMGDLQVIEGRLQISQLQGITHWRQYDNQPAFFLAGEPRLLSSSWGEGAKEQIDSVLYDLVSSHS
ncbi:MAG: hypothetical protein ACJA13_003677 [Paraglaciecola sp.]|jgi:hypothetical protein